MLYLRNTNQQQTLTQQAGVARGNAPERAWSAVSASYLANTFTTGALQILNDNVVISTLSASGSTFNARISASNDIGVTLSGSTTALTGSFTMSLIINSPDYNYTNIVYSPGAMITTFPAVSSSVYNITASLTYTDGVNPFTTCSYYWVKSGEYVPMTASYTQCNATSSTTIYVSPAFTSASLGCVVNDSVTLMPDTGAAAAYQQIWKSPYGCDFTYPTASGGGRPVLFEAPESGPLNPAGQWYLASWVKYNENTYSFHLLQPGESITVCTQDTSSVFNSKGADVPFMRDYVTFLPGPCS